MSTSLPVKNLIKVNGVITVLIASLFFIYLYAVTQNVYTSFIRFLQNLIFMGLLSFGNLSIRILLNRKNKCISLTGKFCLYLCSYVLTILIWLLVRNIYCYLTGEKWEGEGVHIYEAYALAILAIWVINTLVLILQHLVILQHSKAQAEINHLQLQAIISETENLALRQQIHPHFLFNALNTIKSLYKVDTQQGEDYLVQLADFLRAAISNHNAKTTLIKTELEFCLNYLKMQQIRFGESLQCTIDVSDETINTKRLPFFSLQPLVENALKHNDLTEESPVTIVIRESGGYIMVTNNVQPRNYKEPSTGQGLYNLSERYRLLANEKILIHSDRYFFTVSLKILDK